MESQAALSAESCTEAGKRPQLYGREPVAGCHEVLLSLVDSKAAEEVLMPFFLKCMELPEESILDEAIRRIPAIQKRFDYRQVRVPH